MEPQNINEQYHFAKQYTESLTYPWFLEYERIARNEPHPSIDKKYPKTTDGTTASVIRKTPHRIIQQLPTGSVLGDKEDWLSAVASFIYRKKIIPYANSQYQFIQKCWSVIEKSMTFGSVYTYVPFVKHEEGFSPDLSLVYWGDIMVQPGKLSDRDADYIFMRSWWRKSDVEALIDRETKLAQKKSYQSTWDVEVLKQVLNSETTKEIVAQTPVEREKAVNTKGAIEMITAFQRGVGANFYTFSPLLNDGDNILRTKENKDPRGDLPLLAAYSDIDYANPLGRGVVEQVGGLQNLMDAEMQMYQYNRALMLNPPIVKWGNFNKNRIKFEPNIIIDAGSDPTAKVEPMVIDTSAIAQFPTNLGTMRNQLLNLLQSPNTDLGAAAGNSKTPQGVVMTGATISVDDNYIRKQFETWFERWSETAINLYFAERTGIEELQLDDETEDILRNLDGFDQSLLSDDAKIRINYDSATPALKFRVDPSSSQMKDDPQQLQIATNLMEMALKFPILNAKWGGPINVDELARKVVRSSSITDPILIAPEPSEEQKLAEKQSKIPSGFSPLFDKPKISIEYGEVEDPASRAALLGLAGAPPQGQLLPTSPRLAELAARQTGEVTPQEAPEPQEPNEGQITPDHVLQAQQNDHSQEMDKLNLMHEIAKTKLQAEQQAQQAQQQKVSQNGQR